MEPLAAPSARPTPYGYVTDPPVDSASDQDIDTLLAVRMGQDLAQFEARLDRLEVNGWLVRSPDSYPSLTPNGVALLRRWLS